MVELVVEVVDFKDELHPDRWAATVSVSVVLTSSSTDPDAVAFEAQVRLGVVAPVGGNVEPKYAGVEVGCRVEVGGEELEPCSQHGHGQKPLRA